MYAPEDAPEVVPDDAPEELVLPEELLPTCCQSCRSCETSCRSLRR